MSPAGCQCPTHLSGVLLIRKKKKKRKKPQTLGCRSLPHLSAFIADDVCECQAPGRPNPLPVYYASETAEAIHARSPFGKIQKVQRELRVFETLLIDRGGLNEYSGSRSPERYGSSLRK